MIALPVAAILGLFALVAAVHASWHEARNGFGPDTVIAWGAAVLLMAAAIGVATLV